VTFQDTVVLAWRNFISFPKKKILTILSIAVGIASVVIISSMGAGSSDMIDAQINNLGIDGLTVYAEKGDTDPQIAETLKNRFDYITDTSPLTFSYSSYRLRGETKASVVVGVGSNFEDTLNAEILHGRFPTIKDIEYASDVAVVDDVFAYKYYKRSNIVGKKLFLNLGNSMRQFEIIGVTTSKLGFFNSFIGTEIPEIIYIPYTVFNMYSSEADADQIAVKCNGDVNYAEAADEIEIYLNKKLQGSSIKVENISSYADKVREVIKIISAFITGVAAVALAVAAIGVVNAMMTNVDSRKKEIGIYMSVGASKRDIWMCFLLEAIYLCISGGIVGLVFGVLISYLLKIILNIPILIGIDSIIYYIFASVAVGASLGCIPAVKASAMEPADVLRE